MTEYFKININNDDDLENILIKYIDNKRLEHTRRVVQKSIELSKLYNAPVLKTKIGAYLHDIAKFFSVEEMKKLINNKYPEINDNMYKTKEIMHGFAAAEFCKKNFGLVDSDILDSIKYHTIGSKNMSLISKIVYLADAIEEKRNWNGVKEVREHAMNDNLDAALLLEMNFKIKYLIKNKIIHPNIMEFRNQIIAKQRGGDS